MTSRIAYPHAGAVVAVKARPTTAARSLVATSRAINPSGSWVCRVEWQNHHLFLWEGNPPAQPFWANNRVVSIGGDFNLEPIWQTQAHISTKTSSRRSGGPTTTSQDPPVPSDRNEPYFYLPRLRSRGGIRLI